ncbi:MULTISPECIES: septum site-determining protein MinC [Helicobacter]|uniref:Septum site-determining protein MinC n=2 Tax=Helicobacter TaxID=209 RepID=A0ABZ3F442_9HELI|nr:septum site-determining protein MinC [Helicobacter rodentium]
MIKTRQHTIRLFEFEENVDSEECIIFIEKHLPLLQHHILGFRGEISEKLSTFLQTHNLSFALLSGTIHTYSAKFRSAGTNALQTKHKAEEKLPKDEPQNLSRTLWVKKVVRSGEEIAHRGDVVIESQVNSGAHIFAEGNLFLLGECSGSIEARGEFIICKKIFAPAILFQDILLDAEILQKINQSSALFKIIFKKDDNVAIKDLK